MWKTVSPLFSADFKPLAFKKVNDRLQKALFKGNKSFHQQKGGTKRGQATFLLFSCYARVGLRKRDRLLFLVGVILCRSKKCQI
jgi:hypothetical protein